MTDTPRSLEWIERLVRIDTTSRGSNLELIEVVAEELRRHGVEPDIRPDPTGQKANLLATIPAADGSRTGGVVLSGHTDVVPVDDQEWTSEPFQPEVRDGRLYGRGTCDMKGYLGVIVAALPELTSARLREPVHLAFSYDEELGCLGGWPMVEAIGELGLAPRVCVVGEPTSMRVVRGHKSVNTVHVTFTGVAAHSSLTPQGVNAIEHAARFITAVRGIADGWRADGPHDEAYLVPASTASVNIVHGGIAGNTVPDRCRIELEFRTIDAVDPQQVVDRLRAEAAEIEQQMQAEQPGARVQVDVPAMVPGLDTPTDSPALAMLRDLGLEVAEGKVTYGTEAGQFAGTGIATVVCGPGDIAQAHAADEYVELSQVEECERFLDRLVASLAEDG
ncbi:acetylornithine deacetylase [Desertihabitans aurantiacus]|uniref:acetylornithine deacetylase n=1 Tax=Desertihabitans aurantiacus TaxID=2282477 RepID=UPI000DF816BE|nr:acetylornithine deacetylase [Desertihabitans aurantiacus]